MSFFDALIKEAESSWVLEDSAPDADDDADDFSLDDTDDGGDAQTDDNADQGDDTAQDDNQDQGDEQTDDQQDDNTDTDDTQEGDDDDTGDDFSLDDEGDGEEGGEEGGEGDEPPADDASADTGSEEELDENDPNYKLKALEKSIFDQLSPEQQKAKIGELKALFTDTYNKSQDIMNIVSSAEKSPRHAKVYDYIMNSLVDLQKYIKDYLANIFDSKTYIENMTELQKYLTLLDTVNNVFIDIRNDIKDDE